MLLNGPAQDIYVTCILRFRYKRRDLQILSSFCICAVMKKTIRYYPRCGQLLGQLVCEVLFACQEPIRLMGSPPLRYSPSIEDCDGN